MSTAPPSPSCGSRRRRPAGIPRPYRRASSCFACVGDDDEAPVQGAQWLSELYRLPTKAFHRHLVAGSPDTCAAALDRYAEAGARHILVMVAGSPAVEHFGQLRAAFVGGHRQTLAGVGVGVSA